jgi:hypothetical protein
MTWLYKVRLWWHEKPVREKWALGIIGFWATVFLGLLFTIHWGAPFIILSAVALGVSTIWAVDTLDLSP